MWCIDHGAALYFHHAWSRRASAAERPYGQIDDHVLLGVASSIPEADERLAPRVTDALLAAAAATVPDEWLVDEPGFTHPDAVRAAYVEVLRDRVVARATWAPPLEVARGVR